MYPPYDCITKIPSTIELEYTTLNCVGVKYACRDTFAQRVIFAQRHFYTKTLLHKDNFAWLDFFFNFCIYNFVFTITVTSNLLPLVSNFVFKLINYFFCLIFFYYHCQSPLPLIGNFFFLINF